ncbi:MAG TPA: riboflavin synthase [Burkholderiales bacterium]|nr:riboflavin synthase [Burkholderiales bacterium]
MFAGIIEATGEISEVKPGGKGLRLTIGTTLDLSDIKVGDSIAVDGICLTVIACSVNSFNADVSRETLNCTAGFAQRGKVNLEKALRLSDRVNGHLVSGHVDGVGKVAKFERTGECYLLAVKAPRGLAKYISRKGSIAVNGVSLTVNKVEGGEFSVNLIPHTLASTNLRYLKRGAKVNLEADMLARYAEQLLMTKRK